MGFDGSGATVGVILGRSGALKAEGVDPSAFCPPVDEPVVGNEKAVVLGADVEVVALSVFEFTLKLKGLCDLVGSA